LIGGRSFQDEVTPSEKRALDELISLGVSPGDAKAPKKCQPLANEKPWYTTWWAKALILLGLLWLVVWFLDR
jgi:hypothetical protein